MRPASYVTLNISSESDLDARPPVEPVEPVQLTGLHRFKTVAFDAAIIREALRVDVARRMLDAGMWIDGVVPECYRTRVREIVLLVFDRHFKGSVLERWTLDAFVYEIRRAIWRDLEPLDPGATAT